MNINRDNLSDEDKRIYDDIVNSFNVLREYDALKVSDYDGAQDIVVRMSTMRRDCRRDELYAKEVFGSKPLTTLIPLMKLTLLKAADELADSPLKHLSTDAIDALVALTLFMMKSNKSLQEEVLEPLRQHLDNRRCTTCGNPIFQRYSSERHGFAFCNACITTTTDCIDCYAKYGLQLDRTHGCDSDRSLDASEMYLRTHLLPLEDNGLAGYHTPLHTMLKQQRLQHKDERTPSLYYGIELEVNVDESVLDAACSASEEQLNGLAVLEEDGSLDHGYEIIFRPMSYKVLTSDMVLNPLRNTLDAITQAGYNDVSQFSAGMHVHLSRDFFSYSSIAGVELAFYMDAMKDHLKWLTKRDPNAYCASKINRAKYDVDRRLRELGVLNKRVTVKVDPSIVDTDDRYNLVNLTNSNTIEVRAFSGTNDYELILARVEFLRCLAHAIRDGKLNGMTLHQLINYKPSPNLKNYIKKHNIKLSRVKYEPEVRITIERSI